ncbi:MAG TPA: extensin family protein [Geminicoccaceae bacterium]|nr:extensin family protein [Geminicoccus sp.]HMU50195.1 extensin family protein [Geminicoccaceae bacterium]
MLAAQGKRAGFGVARALVGALAMLALLAGCTRYEPRTRGPSTTVWPTGGSCLVALADQGIAVRPWPAPISGGCAVDTPVVPAGDRPLLSPPPRTSCAMLYAWSTFEPTVDQLARRHLGSGLRSVQNYGSHACRAMTGNRSRLSLHASARALDIAAFELANGDRIVVQTAWKGRGPEAAFLRAVARAACERFSVVLTPETDAAHQDHIHVDIGPWKVCDA